MFVFLSGFLTCLVLDIVFVLINNYLRKSWYLNTIRRIAEKMELEDWEMLQLDSTIKDVAVQVELERIMHFLAR